MNTDLDDMYLPYKNRMAWGQVLQLSRERYEVSYMQKAQSPSSMPWGSGEKHLVPREPEEIIENVSDLRLGKQRHVFLVRQKKPSRHN